MKIFLADDHHLFLEGIQTILTNLGSDIEVEYVFNGHDALEKLSEQSYDIALINLRLPGIDGFGLLTKLADLSCLTPVIIVTASEDPDDIKQALNLGAMGFYLNPLVANKLPIQ